LLFCHAFSNLQKTGINIDDLTHSMASDVSTWQIIGMDFGLQQTPRQRSNRIPPGICQLIPQTKPGDGSLFNLLGAGPLVIRARRRVRCFTLWLAPNRTPELPVHGSLILLIRHIIYAVFLFVASVWIHRYGPTISRFLSSPEE
jgi:hypothetical protein